MRESGVVLALGYFKDVIAPTKMAFFYRNQPATKLEENNLTEIRMVSLAPTPLDWGV